MQINTKELLWGRIIHLQIKDGLLGQVTVSIKTKNKELIIKHLYDAVEKKKLETKSK